MEEDSVGAVRCQRGGLSVRILWTAASCLASPGSEKPTIIGSISVVY